MPDGQVCYSPGYYERLSHYGPERKKHQNARSRDACSVPLPQSGAALGGFAGFDYHNRHCWRASPARR